MEYLKLFFTNIYLKVKLFFVHIHVEYFQTEALKENISCNRDYIRSLLNPKGYMDELNETFQDEEE